MFVCVCLCASQHFPAPAVVQDKVDNEQEKLLKRLKPIILEAPAQILGNLNHPLPDRSLPRPPVSCGVPCTLFAIISSRRPSSISLRSTCIRTGNCVWAIWGPQGPKCRDSWMLACRVDTTQTISNDAFSFGLRERLACNPQGHSSHARCRSARDYVGPCSTPKGRIQASAAETCEWNNGKMPSVTSWHITRDAAGQRCILS